MERIKALAIYRNHRWHLWVILACLLLILTFQSIALASNVAGFTDMKSLVGVSDSYLSLMNGQGYFTLDEDIPSAASPLSAYFGAEQIVLIVPGFLLLCFIVWFFYKGFMEARQGKILEGLIYATISLILICVTLLVAMPLILTGADSIIWFK